MFDLESYLEANEGKRSLGFSGPQMVMPCPWCGRSDLYVALERRERVVKGEVRFTYPGDFVCFSGKCSDANDGNPRAGRFAKLYAELEGIDVKDARIQLVKERMGERLPNGATVKGTVAAVRERMGAAAPPAPTSAQRHTPTGTGSESNAEPAGRAAEHADTAQQSSVAAQPASPVVDSPLPDEFEPVFDGERYDMPDYLLARGITRRNAARFGLGFCRFGRYAERIVLPVSCPLGRSFTTRAIDPDVELRYLAGPGAGRLLFGWAVAMEVIAEQPVGDRFIIVVEGPFDAIACRHVGLPAVAIMGKRFKGEQIDMVVALPVDTVYLMLDTDALRDAVQQAGAFGTRARVVTKLGGKDAAQLVEEGSGHLLAEALEGAKPLDAARLEVLTNQVANIRSRLQGTKSQQNQDD